MNKIRRGILPQAKVCRRGINSAKTREVVVADFSLRSEYIFMRNKLYRPKQIIKKGWDYKFSGLERYDKEYVRDCLRLYPIIDFGGNYE